MIETLLFCGKQPKAKCQRHAGRRDSGRECLSLPWAWEDTCFLSSSRKGRWPLQGQKVSVDRREESIVSLIAAALKVRSVTANCKTPPYAAAVKCRAASEEQKRPVPLSSLLFGAKLLLQSVVSIR